MKCSNEFPVSRQTGGVSDPVNWGGRGSDHRWRVQLTTGHHAVVVFQYFEQIVDFLLMGSHAPSIMKEPHFEIYRAC
jgi:hypothetical protein